MDTASVDDGIVLGPDLNPARSKMDKKLYRHITLPNGLKCLLICDVVALRQRKSAGYGSDDDDSEEEDGRDEGDEDDDEDDNDADGGDNEDDEGEDIDGLRKAATALLVNVGSYHDPPHLQGLAHFLEHMLFLGTEAFPRENAYDAFLSRRGGDDNAYTEMEHTLFHYCLPQDGGLGERGVWRALEMFAAFFKCPLLGGERAGRELRAVESEFELNRKDDGCRRSQVRSFTCGMDGHAPIMGKYAKIMGKYAKEEEGEGGTAAEKQRKPFHPFAKFPWGNMSSLRTEPEADGVDVMGELRAFYHAHYYARNMRLVVLAGYELDEIQRRVVQHFKDVPGDPRNADGTSSSTDNCGGITHLHPYQLPFHPSSLTKLYRIVPVRNRHSLALMWQIPSVCQQWRTKPTDYLAHLLGHEASGSILSWLKERGWATGLSAGRGEDGEADASTHALFEMEIDLSMHGVGCWEQVVQVVFAYIGMLKYFFLRGHDVHNNSGGSKKEEGLPPWIYDELKSIAELSYRYADEGDVTDVVEELAENMAPWQAVPDERILDVELLFDDAADHSTVKSLLFDYFTPGNSRVELTSSRFGVDGGFDDSALSGEEKKDEQEDEDGALQSMDLDDKAKSNGPLSMEPPSIEPRFGTKFWVFDISSDIIQSWTDVAEPQLPDLPLHLPPRNPYIPTKFDLKPLPTDDSAHPLLNCSVKVQITVGRRKSWFPAAVTKYQTEKNAHRLCLSYEDEGKKWHVLDSPETYSKFQAEQSLEVGYEGTLDNGVKFRVTGIPREGEGIVFSYGDVGHSDDVEEGAAFPPIPPPSPASRLPLLVYERHSFKLWHLQDRKFNRPLADLRLNIVCEGLCEGMDGSALNQACMDLFCKLCTDALTETCYLASVCELGSSLYPTDNGFSVRVWGFDHNLLALAKEVLAVVMAFRGRETDLPATIQDERFDACLEVLLRNYSNAGMDASSFSARLRLLCLRPAVKSSFAKLKALQGITVSAFLRVTNKLLSKLSVEAFYHGNVNRKDADQAASMISGALTDQHVGLPKKKLPAKLVIKTKQAIDPQQIIAPTIDPKDPNTAVEVYFQLGKDDNSPKAIEHRVLVDLMEQILEEPLYNQIRTKEMFGYEVSCGARWTYGILGMSFRVVTASKSADEVSSRINEFLTSFRSELDSMDHKTFMEHLVGLAKNKLESFDSLEDETSSHWSEIIEGRYDFEAYRKEVLCLRSISKDKLTAAYDEWLYPLCKHGKPKKRRQIVVSLIGSGDGAASHGRPALESNTAVGDEIDCLVQQFHSSVKYDSWGRLCFT